MAKHLSLLLVAAPPLLMLLLFSSVYGSSAGGGPNLNASAVSFGQSGVARATWYGAPNGAGPYDNGMYLTLFPLLLQTDLGQ